MANNKTRGSRTFERLTFPALLYLSLWLVIAIVAASTAFIALRGTSVAQWFAVLGIMLKFFYVWAGIAVLIYILQRRSSAWSAALLKQAALHGVFLIAILFTMPFLIHGEDWPDWLYGSRASAFHALNILLYAFVLIGCKIIDYYRLGRLREAELHKAELRRIELERSLENSRMDALRAQINPHFLFNALNSLASLIESSSNNEAYEVVERLASLLRNALDYSSDRMVTLQEELAFLEAYVAIEKIRFGDRLTVSNAIPDDCLKLAVPAFCLQPLVENSIKHGVSSTGNPVSIQISAACIDDTLELEVTDDGPGLAQLLEPGVGLTNIKSRLDHLFGDLAQLDYSNTGEGGARITLAIPRRDSKRNSTAGKEPINEVAPAM